MYGAAHLAAGRLRRGGRWPPSSASLLGLLSGYLGGMLDSFIMRVADIQLTFPAILIALLIDGVARSVLPRSRGTRRQRSPS